ncbi:helix-turn-helix domain-containing protein [Carboxydocella sp. ULO1]|uniref:helix-turn-helix domain-containing protein n=1 Tax=Carboxydocella sp. ULO1 TaxID=1926599 RepID=UPI0009D43058|nr:helix-turn-helix transcriptional regulator [Carboxydocella sp. ULO1]GAW28553.1 Helix-turn-helix [Carboxydocella sp. ULO1]
MNIIGKRLHELRVEKQLSLRKLAKKSGISHSFLCDIERGRSQPSLDTLGKLADTLGVKIEFFLSQTVVNNDHLGAEQKPKAG